MRPRCESGLPYPRPRAEPLRYRAEIMEPEKGFDQMGFELPPAPEQPADVRPGSDSCSATTTSSPMPPIANRCSGPALPGQPFPDNNFVQADAPESF